MTKWAESHRCWDVEINWEGRVLEGEDNIPRPRANLLLMEGLEEARGLLMG